MIDPQVINPLTLPSVSLEDRSQLPTTPCIYFAIDSAGCVQYIGKSVNPKARWAEHHRYDRLFAMGSIRIGCLSVDSDLLLEVEAALVAWFDPPLNGWRDRTAIRRSKKPAKRQNYKISYRLLAGLKGVAILEDRSDTAQLERWIREGIDRWQLENPSKLERFEALASDFLASEGVEDEGEEL